MSAPNPDRRVSVVTGGGGIGAAVATELARRGDHVVTVDPLVSLDGAEQLTEPEHTTAGRILGAGGSAHASNASVTDREAMTALAADLMDRHGRIDAVVNVAGISRPTGFARGDETDWSEVLAVHLDGYRNVLEAVLPHMADAGRGHVVGVTSGSGWRSADAGAYGCAKRAVASLTWQLARAAPPGVVVNAISPIAVTRMVTAALGARPATARPGGSPSTGGLSLGSMPAPEQLAPLVAALAGHGALCNGRVVFAGGSEVAVVDEPRLLEVVRTDDVDDVASVLATFREALETAESTQSTGGGTNPRFPSLFEPADLAGPDVTGLRAAIVSDRAALAGALAAGLTDAGASTTSVSATPASDRTGDARAALRDAAGELGGLDAVVVALTTASTTAHDAGWWEILTDHVDLRGRILEDAAWVRAAADHSETTDRPMLIVTVTDAATPAGRSRAQAAAQLARAAPTATGRRVTACSVSAEARDELTSTAALVGTLASGPTTTLGGAELVIGAGWLGLRSHPRPTGSIVFGGPELPDWFGDVFAELVR